jgi:hypothetical protein
MTRLRHPRFALAVGALLLSLAAAGPALARASGHGGGGFGGGHFGGGHFGGGHFGFGPHGGHGFRGLRGPGIVIGGGGFFYDPYPYPYPYYYYYEDEPEALPPPANQAPVPPDASGGAALGAPAGTATTGLIRLIDVPNGARLSLDGRYWLEAHELDDYWFRLPPGTHTLGIRANGYPPLERQIDVVAGSQQDVILGLPMG